MSTGLVSKSSQPAAIAFSLSPAMAFAVSAITGMRLVAGSALIRWVASSPRMSGSEVHENEVGLLGSRHCNALRPIGCNNDGKARPREPVFQHVNIIVIVLNVENLHASPTVCRLTHLASSRLSCRNISSRSLF